MMFAMHGHDVFGDWVSVRMTPTQVRFFSDCAMFVAQMEQSAGDERAAQRAGLWAITLRAEFERWEKATRTTEG